MRQFLMGVVAMGFWAAGLFFLRFWVRTRDPLFALFAASFWLMALNRTALTFLSAEHDARIYAYGLRLVSFLLIIAAIVYKNRRPPPGPGP